MEKVTMAENGKIEQLAMEYLNDVRLSDITGNYKDGILSPVEAKNMIDHIINARKASTLKMQRPNADYRLALDGLSSSRVPIKESYLFSRNTVNESVFDKVNHVDRAVRDAADVLVRYATGDGGMVDPMTLYKATRRMIDAKIMPSKVFTEIAWESGSRAFGEPMPISHNMLDSSTRRFGGKGVISESPTEFAKNITKCLGGK